MNKRKLLLYSDCYIYGGSERLMSFLVKNEVLNRNYEIRFAFRNHKIYKEGMAKDFSDRQEKLIPLNLLSNDTISYVIKSHFSNKWIQYCLLAPLWVVKKIGLYSVYNSFILYKLLKQEQPDLIHINNGGFPAAASCNLMVFVARICAITKVFYQVNNQAEKSTIFNSFRNKKLNDYVSAFITSSSMAKNNLTKNAGIEIDKISVIRNVVKLNPITKHRGELTKEFGLNEGTFIMTQVAFLTKRKGQIYLLQALKRWIESVNYEIDFCFFLIGNGEDDSLLKDFCLKNGLINKVKFLGYRSNYADFINASDLVVFPSISNEDLPLVIIESLMLGKCILSTSLAGISEVIVNNQNGILVSPDLSSIEEELYNKIDFLFSNPDEIKRIGKAAEISSESFSEYIYGNCLKQLYQKC